MTARRGSGPSLQFPLIIIGLLTGITASGHVCIKKSGGGSCELAALAGPAANATVAEGASPAAFHPRYKWWDESASLCANVSTRHWRAVAFNRARAAWAKGDDMTVADMLHCLTARCVAVSGDRCMGTWEGQQQEQAEGRKEHGEGSRCMMTEEEMAEVKALHAQSLMSLGQLQEAIRVLHGASVLALPPLAKAKVYYLLGAAFAARGPAHLKQASIHYKTALSFHPTHGPSLRRLGALLLAEGYEREGLHYLNRAVTSFVLAARASLAHLPTPTPRDNSTSSSRSSEEKEGEEEAAAERLWLCEAVLLPSLAGLPGPEDQHLDSIDGVNRLSRALRRLARPSLDAHTHFMLGRLLGKHGYLPQSAIHLGSAASPWSGMGPSFAMRASLSLPLLFDSQGHLAASGSSLESALDALLLPPPPTYRHHPQPVSAAMPLPLDEDEEASRLLVSLWDCLPLLPMVAAFAEPLPLPLPRRPSLPGSSSSHHHLDTSPPLPHLAWSLIASLVGADRLVDEAIPPPAGHRKRRRGAAAVLRVGFVTGGHFRNHPLGKTLAGVMSGLAEGGGNGSSSAMEVWAISGPTLADPHWTATVQQAAKGGRMVNLQPHNRSASVSRLLSHEEDGQSSPQFDVLVYVDLGRMLHASPSLLAISRLAPTQVMLATDPLATAALPLGLPSGLWGEDGHGGSGSSIDYVLCPHHPLLPLPPDPANEQLMLLPGLPPYLPPSTRPLLDPAALRSRLLLPPTAPLLLLACPLSSLAPSFDPFLHRLLASQPSAVLVIAQEASRADRDSHSHSPLSFDPLQQSFPPVWTQRFLTRLTARLDDTMQASIGVRNGGVLLLIVLSISVLVNVPVSNDSASRVRVLGPLPRHLYLSLLHAAALVLEPWPLAPSSALWTAMDSTTTPVLAWRPTTTSSATSTTELPAPAQNGSASSGSMPPSSSWWPAGSTGSGGNEEVAGVQVVGVGGGGSPTLQLLALMGEEVLEHFSARDETDWLGKVDRLLNDGQGGEALRRLWQEGRSDERVRVWEEEHVAAWRRALMTMARQHRQMAAG